jgi:LRR receptor-like serine/threonine-protein kinase FLS2
MSQDAICAMCAVAVNATGALLKSDGSRCNSGSCTFLTLHQQNITSFTVGSLDAFSNVQTLDLRKNNVRDISCFEFGYWPNLQVLLLDDNQISGIGPNDFKGMPSLQIVKLDGNNITNLDMSVFHGLTKLMNLSITRSNVKHLLHSNYSRGGNEQTMKSILSQPAGELAGLRILRLGSNQIQALPKGLFIGLPHLIEIDMSYNRLNAIPDGIFSSMTNLETLLFDGNQLSEIGKDSLQGLGSSLKILHLSSNRIERVHRLAFMQLSGLRELNLGNNKLSSLSWDVFDAVPGRISTYGNPFICVAANVTGYQGLPPCLKEVSFPLLSVMSVCAYIYIYMYVLLK